MTKSIQQIIDDERKKSRLGDVSEATINRALANEWKRNDPDFSKTMSKVATDRNQDSEYIEKLHNGIADRDNTYQAECNARPEVKEKISKSLRENYTKTEEHLAKVAAKNKERSKPIMTPWGEFVSRKAAVVWAQENTDIGNVDKKIQKWVKTPGSGYYYI